jgi:hypothetical protein
MGWAHYTRVVLAQEENIRSLLNFGADPRSREKLV